MKTFKKLFAFSAIFALLATLLPTYAFGASYSAELEGAYDYAKGHGITTMDSIENADMYGSLTRVAMAKMMANYSMDVLGLTPDTTMECNFPDVSEPLNAQYDNGVTNACQLGLMGVGITNFNPYGLVTRAEFGTVLSRAMYGEENNGGNPYYADHLAALKDAGIMTQISNPMQLEVRGYVMLMMQRASDDSSTSGCTAEELLACITATDYDACIAACSDEDAEPVEVKAGTLNVSTNSNTLVEGSQIPMAGIVKFAGVDFKATSNDISLKTVELSKVGLAAINSNVRVWFEKDWVRVSGRAAFTSEGKAIISFAPMYVVKAGSTETLDLYVELSDSSAGTDYRFTSSDVSSTALYTNGSFTTPTLRTANYTVAGLNIEAASATWTANVTTNGMELWAFKLIHNYTGTETRDIMFKSITLRQNGNANLSNLGSIILERNGTVVASNPKIDGRNITFTVMNEIKHATNATYYIKAVVNNVDTSSDTYQFELRNTTDLNAAETSTSFRSSVNQTLTLNTYTIQGGEMTFARDTAYPLSANYAAWSDVVLMKGTIKSNNAITLEDPTVYLSSTPASGLNAMFTTIYLQIGSSIFSYSPTAWTTWAHFVGSATVNGTANVKMYGRLKDTSPSQTVKFQDLKLSSFRIKEYVSNGVTVNTSIGNIAAISVASQTATLNVTKTDGLWTTTIAKGSNNVLVYGLRMSSTQGNWVTLSRVTLTLNGNDSSSTGYTNNADLTLYVNGTAIATKSVSSNTVTFDSFSRDILVGSPLDIEVKANFSESFTGWTFRATLASVNAIDKLTSATVTPSATPNGATFTIDAAVGTLAASNENPLSTLLLSPATDQKLVAFKVTATNDNIRLYDVDLTGTNLNNLSNFRLTNSTWDVIATATTVSSTAVAFSEIANAPVINKDTSANYFVIADVNTNTTGTTVSLTVDQANMNIKGSNGLTIAAAGSSVTSRTHAIAENTMVVAKLANSGKALTTSALRFSVTAAGKDSVTLTGLTLTTSLVGYTGMTNVVVYKNSIGATNKVGEAVFTGVTQTIALTANGSVNSIIDAWSTVNYLVVVEWALVSGTAFDWNVTVSDVLFGGIGAKDFYNLGDFPMTETK